MMKMGLAGGQNNETAVLLVMRIIVNNCKYADILTCKGMIVGIQGRAYWNKFCTENWTG